MTRESILKNAMQIVTRDRNATYGEPEDNFMYIADLWNAYLHAKGITTSHVDAEDVAMMMVLFKVGRIATAKEPHEDSYTDVAGCIACAGEIAERNAKIRREQAEAMQYMNEKYSDIS